MEGQASERRPGRKAISWKSLKVKSHSLVKQRRKINLMDAGRLKPEKGESGDTARQNSHFSGFSLTREPQSNAD